MRMHEGDLHADNRNRSAVDDPTRSHPSELCDSYTSKLLVFGLMAIHYAIEALSLTSPGANSCTSCIILSLSRTRNACAIWLLLLVALVSFMSNYRIQYLKLSSFVYNHSYISSYFFWCHCWRLKDRFRRDVVHCMFFCGTEEYEHDREPKVEPRPSWASSKIRWIVPVRVFSIVTYVHLLVGPLIQQQTIIPHFYNILIASYHDRFF